MRRFAIFYLEISAFALIIVSHSHDSQRRKRHWKLVNGEHDVIRRKRTFGSSEPPCNMTTGVYLEKWEKIDYKRIRFLLEDPRYPNLPSFSTCVPTFEQPSNWGDFFGSRLRTYFVPFQTGDHFFFLSSNAGSELFLSTNASAGAKTLISYVDGGFPTKQYEYDRFTNQKTLPISLKKGKYYYMEAIMKDDHQEDHLEVGLQTPDGTFYKVIPSKFLWTTLHLSASQNFTYQSILIKVAAKAGASAGSSFGEKSAMKSGAVAGAMAGAMAGRAAGASAGAAAGERAAMEMTTKTIEDALNSLHGDTLHKYNIILRNGNVAAVTGPGLDGAEEGGPTPGGTGWGNGPNEAGGTSGVTSNGFGGSAGGSGVKGSGNAETGTGTGASGTGAGAGGAWGAGTGAGTGAGESGSAGARTGSSVSENTGGATSAGASVSGVVAGGVGGGTGSSGGGAINMGGMLSGSIAHRKVTYIPKPGEDPQALARSLVWRVGGATKLVDKGLYTAHSFDVPYQQENTSLNFCWKADNGDVALRPFCQVFQARIPGLYNKVEDRNETVSFESVCLPGYFMRQKNYHFILEKRDGSDLFDKESSFTVYSVMKISRNLMLQSMHKDWYVCQSKTKVKEKTDIKLDFYNGKPDVLNRCTFMFHPMAQNEDKYRNCKNVLGPVKHPAIAGQPLPHPPHLVPRKPKPPSALPTCIPVCPMGSIGGESGQAGINNPSVSTSGTVSRAAKMCVALNFVNNFGSPFKLYSSLKHGGYLVSGKGIKLRLMIDRPELHSHVTFYAEDPTGRSELLLNGVSSISEPTILGCPKFLTVLVTPGKELTHGGLPSSAAFTSTSSASHSMSLHGAHPPHPPPVYTSPTILPSTSSSLPAAVPPPAASSVASQSTTSGESYPHKDHKVVHYHYHYHDPRQPETTTTCPNICARSEECHPSCPLFCCKRNKAISTGTKK